MPTTAQFEPAIGKLRRVEFQDPVRRATSHLDPFDEELEAIEGLAIAFPFGPDRNRPLERGPFFNAVGRDRWNIRPGTTQRIADEQLLVGTGK